MKQFLKNNIWSLVFLSAYVLELALHTFQRKLFGVYLSPIIIVVSGFLFIIAAHKLTLNYKKEDCIGEKSNIYRLIYISAYLFYCLLFLFFFKGIIVNYEINSNLSDVIPSLQNYVKRLFEGENVYAPMQYDGWVVHPNYLTFQWLPFSISEFFQFDYRYVALLAFYIACFFLVWEQAKQKISAVNFIRLFLPLLLLWLIKDYHPDVFGFSIEFLIAAYYMIFGLSLFNGKTWILILGISLCLLSRFSFLFWLPVLALYFFSKYPAKKIFAIMAGVVSFGVVFYVLPFMTKDPGILLRGMQYYADAAIGEWVLKPFQQTEEYPFHLGKGIGFAIYFYDFFEGSLEEKVIACRNAHILISLLCTLFISVFFWLNKHKLSKPIFVLLSLKLYFILFYSFIHVPYVYLQVVPLSISILIFYKTPLFTSIKT